MRPLGLDRDYSFAAVTINVDQSHLSNAFPSLNVISEAGLDEVVQSERSTQCSCTGYTQDYKSSLTDKNHKLSKSKFSITIVGNIVG